ncbi:unnamed protein product [Protopolystoma xenopodis]|uniref:Uncharacterized protein n=1 Tax=Protopolystoma xenopodis TaxID=117903 RepID=A0A448WSD7_9PLAT|nr:unnamed protein product [Protopolystoma xenopodis]
MAAHDALTTRKCVSPGALLHLMGPTRPGNKTYRPGNTHFISILETDDRVDNSRCRQTKSCDASSGCRAKKPHTNTLLTCIELVEDNFAYSHCTSSPNNRRSQCVVSVGFGWGGLQGPATVGVLSSRSFASEAAHPPARPEEGLSGNMTRRQATSEIVTSA